ncbi:MAG: GTP cyclohydrolase II [Deltaproteobacteria bacterium]|nr:GTP cyclohydrolase II [Deltaproteobacteria bacterium]
MNNVKLSPIAEVIEDYRQGKMVIIVDDADRENEGDVCLATEHVTPEALSFMIEHSRGLICVSISRELAEKLNLPPQSDNNNSRFGTPFTLSVDHKDVCFKGITASSRSFTMQRLMDLDCKEGDFVSPGHVYPLVANPAGVLARRGQTEGSYDLARLAGLKSSGVICEILNPDGTMARGAQINDFAEKHSLKITSIEEIVRYRIEEEILIEKVTSSQKVTDYGTFEVSVYRDHVENKEHIALAYGDLSAGVPPLVRVHSECLTGDVFGSRRCDCGPQLDQALQQIVEHGVGIILYLRQEGRGIGLSNKLKAYELQDKGRDTVEANIELGFEADLRDFAVAAKILHSLNVGSIRLLTNNPRKLERLVELGVEVLERLPVFVEPDECSKHYLQTKKEKLGHFL